MVSFQNLTSQVDVVIEQNSDPFIDNYPLMSSYWLALLLVLVYNGIVAIGPRIMAAKEAFRLQNVMILYNFSVTILSLYMTIELFLAAKFSPSFSLSCFPMDRKGDSHGMRMRNVMWLYFVSKIIEFMDTLFFILRKKQSQVSFLHVYHHTNVVVVGWLAVKFVPTGESYFVAMLNSGVHVIMYFYYMLTAMGPQVQQYLWWKRYLTQIQLIQFVVIISHYSYIVIFNNKNCDFPQSVLIGYTVNGITFFLLFMHFYSKAYRNAAEKQQIKSD